MNLDTHEPEIAKLFGEHGRDAYLLTTKDIAKITCPQRLKPNHFGFIMYGLKGRTLQQPSSGYWAHNGVWWTCSGPQT
jgi:hypothetical protein